MEPGCPPAAMEPGSPATVVGRRPGPAVAKGELHPRQQQQQWGQGAQHQQWAGRGRGSLAGSRGAVGQENPPSQDVRSAGVRFEDDKSRGAKDGAQKGGQQPSRPVMVTGDSQQVSSVASFGSPAPDWQQQVEEAAAGVMVTGKPVRGQGPSVRFPVTFTPSVGPEQAKEPAFFPLDGGLKQLELRVCKLEGQWQELTAQGSKRAPTEAPACLSQVQLGAGGSGL